MKRLIKYWNQYNSDGARFSTCSTHYEVLDLVNDDFHYKELKQLAETHGFETVGKCFDPSRDDKSWGRSFKITEAIKLKEVHQETNCGKIEEYQYYLGFIEIKEDRYVDLPPVETANTPLPEELDDECTVHAICNGQAFGVDDVREIGDSGLHIVIQNWNFFHELPLLGYSLESFKEMAGTDEYTFNDKVDFCHRCGAYDWRDGGYTYNFRIVEGGAILGINCGCFDHHCKSDEGLESYADNTDSAMEPEAIEHHMEFNNIEFMERFVGGMTDSWRSHTYNGETVAISSPEEALKKYKSKYPDHSFLFCHDESGQFQTYFSIYKINKGA